MSQNKEPVTINMGDNITVTLDKLEDGTPKVTIMDTTTQKQFSVCMRKNDPWKIEHTGLYDTNICTENRSWDMFRDNIKEIRLEVEADLENKRNQFMYETYNRNWFTRLIHKKDLEILKELIKK